jgi:hypothetical protein
LGVDHLLIDGGRMFEGREHTFLGDLVEHQPSDLLLVAAAELLGKMPSDGLSLAIGVGCDEDLVDSLGAVLEVLQNLLTARDHFIRRLETVVHIDAELAFGQVADVAHRGDDLVVPAEIFVDGLRLCRRFHHDQCLCHKTEPTLPEQADQASRCGVRRMNLPPEAISTCPSSSNSMRRGSSFDAAVPVASTRSSSRYPSPTSILANSGSS